MKIYLVSSGCYSDYSIEAAFSSIEKADAFVAMMLRGDPDGDWKTEALAVDELPADGRIPCRVYMSEAGNVLSDSTFGECTVPISTSIQRYDTGDFAIECWADNREHAIKVANEQRIVFLARGGPA